MIRQPCLALASLPALIGAAWADEPAREAGIVTIVAQQPTSLPTRIPTTLEGLDAERLATTVNATDSEDALKYLPSLLVRKRYPGDYNHAVLSTRASGTGNSARSLVYADGVLLSNLLGNGAAFTPRWGLVTPEEIERVDVLYGPFSAAYPGNSVGAVVDYTTRLPSRFEAHAKVGLFVQPFDLYASHGRYQGRQASASLGSRDGGFAWWFNLSRLDSEGQPLTFATRLPSQGSAGTAGTPVTGAVAGRNRSDQPIWILADGTQYHTVQDHAKLKLAYDLGPTLRASATLALWRNAAQGESNSYLRDAGGAPVTATSGGGASQLVNIDGRSYTLGAADLPRNRDALRHRMHALALKERGRGAFAWELAVSGYRYERDDSRAFGPAAGNLQAGRLTDLGGTGWSNLSAKGVWRPGGEGSAHVVDFGLQQDSQRLRQRSFALDEWTAGEPTGAAVARFEGQTRLRSLFAQDTWAFADGWRAVAGLRAERWEAFGGLTANANGAVAHPERREHHLSPKFALGTDLGEHWTLKASTGRAWRMPTVSELYQGGLNAAGTALTNNDPGLKPERSQTSELSAEWQDGTLRARATLFHEDTRDALYSQTNVTVTPNVTSIQNVDRIRTTGMEFAFDGRELAGGPLTLSASLTWADSKIVRNDKFPASVGRWQPRVPRWRATALATWRVDERLSASFGARYSGRQYSTLDNSDINGFAYQGASRYFTTDLRLRWRFLPQWTAAFGIDNLNNAKYWNFHPYPQRTWSAELGWDL